MSKTRKASDGDAVHPELEANGSFEHLKLGKLEPRLDPRTLMLARYLDDAVALPDLPEVLEPPRVDAWPMFANDRWGDCTIAAAAHMVQAWTADAGAPRVPAEADVEAAYIPGTGPDDTGRFELDVLNYWRTTGIGPDKIDAFAAVDQKNHDHVKAAAYLFGGVYIGALLPLTARGQAVWDVVGDGQTGDSQPGSWGGHAVDVVAYDGEGVTVVTWGALLRMTWGFWDAYVDEAYAIVSTGYLDAGGRTPQGFDLAALQADLAAITAPAQAPAPTGEAATEEADDETAEPVDPGEVIKEMTSAPAEEQGAFDADYFWNG